MPSLSFAPTGNGTPVLLSSTAGHVTGLQEATDYRVEVHGATVSRFYIDDVELRADAACCYAWTANFYAGEVAAIVVDSAGQQQHFRLDVSPSPTKLSADQYAAMLQDVRAFDAMLLLGPSAAALGFGTDGRRSRWEPLVQLARLRVHGPGFLSAISSIARSPHQFLRATERPMHLRHLRRVHPAALLDRRLVALTTATPDQAEALQVLQLRSTTAAPTVDTAANRTLKALLQRFVAAIQSLVDVVSRNGLCCDSDDQELRRPMRLEVLRTLGRGASELLAASPFCHLGRAETSSAGLTQIAAHPRYARAYRLGTQALRLSVDGAEFQDQLAVAPSWGIYETWCFVAVGQLLERLVVDSLSAVHSNLASADLTLAGRLPDGRRVEALFQAVFPSEGPFAKSAAWSISRERRPDIVLALEDGQARRWLVLDAKYRSGRVGTLDAMSSAHIYRDALRVGRAAPEKALLLLPGDTTVPSLEGADFWNEHHVGTLSNFSPGGSGLDRLANFVATWLKAPDSDRPNEDIDTHSAQKATNSENASGRGAYG